MYSTYRVLVYSWFSNAECKKKVEDKRLGALIKINFKRSRETYGYRRIYHDLKSQGEKCGKPRVAKIMKLNEIRPKTRRKFKMTTDLKHDKPIFNNLLSRDFYAAHANQKWSSDITYIPTKEG
jgi:putative transposase